VTGENQRTRRKACPSATLSTTNPTWIDLGLCGERPAANDLSHGTANMNVTQGLGFGQVFSLLSKMKVGLSKSADCLSVCVCVCVCVHARICLCTLLITFELISGFS
jgi:hypothetical protein